MTLREIQYSYFDGAFTWKIHHIRYGLQWLTFWQVETEKANGGD